MHPTFGLSGSAPNMLPLLLQILGLHTKIKKQFLILAYYKKLRATFLIYDSIFLASLVCHSGPPQHVYPFFTWNLSAKTYNPFDRKYQTEICTPLFCNSGPTPKMLPPSSLPICINPKHAPHFSAFRIRPHHVTPFYLHT